MSSCVVKSYLLENTTNSLPYSYCQSTVSPPNDSIAFIAFMNDGVLILASQPLSSCQKVGNIQQQSSTVNHLSLYAWTLWMTWLKTFTRYFPVIFGGRVGVANYTSVEACGDNRRSARGGMLAWCDVGCDQPRCKRWRCVGRWDVFGGGGFRFAEGILIFSAGNWFQDSIMGSANYNFCWLSCNNCILL